MSDSAARCSSRLRTVTIGKYWPCVTSTLTGASGYGQCVESVCVVAGGGQWVVDLFDYLVIKYLTSLVSVILAVSSLLSVQFSLLYYCCIIKVFL